MQIDEGVIELARDRTGGNFRKTKVWMKGLERIAKANGIHHITMENIGSFENAENRKQ